VAAVLLLSAVSASPADAASRRSLKYGFPQDRIEVFDFELTRSTSLAMKHLPAEAQGFDVESLIARLGTVETRLEGRLERVLARVFRDFSQGLVTRVVDVDGTIDRGAGAEALDTSILEGKSVSFRLLASGELLDSVGWSRLAGAERGGTLVEELLLQSVMRLPQSIPKGTQMFPANYRVRVPLDSFLTRDQTWIVGFTAGTAPAECGRGCVAIDYRGELSEKAIDKHPARPMRLTGKGTVSGTIVLTRREKNLYEHTFVFDWAREVRSERDNDTLRGEVVQTERVEGVLRAVASE
jgi:hypothetical protein